MPPVTKNLLIINCLVALASVVLFSYGIDLYRWCGLHFIAAPDFHPYQFVTYMFLHGGYSAVGNTVTGVDIQGVVMHLFFNMFALWMFGRIIEQVMGAKRFLIYYMVCGIGAGVIQELAQAVHFWVVINQYTAQYGISPSDLLAMPGFRESLNFWSTVGASGAIYAILLAFGMTFPNERLFIIPIPIPIKAKFFVAGYAVIELLQALTSSGDGVAHMAHLGGMLFGAALIIYWRKKGGNGGTYMGNSHWDGYEIREDRPSWRDRLRRLFARRPHMKVNKTGKHADEMDYNERERQREEEVDRILDKVKKHGYGALSESEKRKLFDASGRK